MDAYGTNTYRTCTASILRVVFLRSDIDLDELKPWFILCNFIEPSLGIVCACGPVIQGLVSSYRKSGFDVSYQDSVTFQTTKSNLDEQPLVPSKHYSKPTWAGGPSFDRTMAFTALPRDSFADPNAMESRWSRSTYSAPAFRHKVEHYSHDEDKPEVPFEATRVKTMAFFDGRPNINREFPCHRSLTDWLDQVPSQQPYQYSTRPWPLSETCSLNHPEAVKVLTKPEEALSF